MYLYIHFYWLIRYLELDTVEFTLGTVFDAVISQGMMLSRAKGLQLLCDSTEEIKTIYLFGDQLRLQQVLSEFLLNALQFTPPEGWVEIKVIPNKKHLGTGLHIMHLEFRYIDYYGFSVNLDCFNCSLPYILFLQRF